MWLAVAVAALVQLRVMEVLAEQVVRKLAVRVAQVLQLADVVRIMVAVAAAQLEMLFFLAVKQ